MKLKLVSIITFLCITFLLPSCEGEPLANYTIQVLCTASSQPDATFWGTYTVDGTIKNMNPEKFGTNSYIYEKDVAAEDIIEISATKDTAGSDLQIKIYKDGEKINEAYLDAYKTATDEYVYTLRLEYEIPDDEEDGDNSDSD